MTNTINAGTTTTTARKSSRKETLTVAKTWEVIAMSVANDTTVRAACEQLYPQFVNDLVDKVNKCNSNAHKTTERPSGPSKAQVENEKLASALESYWSKNKNVVLTLKDITTKLDNVSSTQKAAQIINVLLANNKVKRADKKVGGHMAYELIA